MDDKRLGSPLSTRLMPGTSRAGPVPGQGFLRGHVEIRIGYWLTPSVAMCMEMLGKACYDMPVSSAVPRVSICAPLAHL